MDLYSILGLEKSATKIEIKKAYRKLAMQYHPDRNAWNKESEKKFKQINEAYSILSDDIKKQQYDTFWTVKWWHQSYGWDFWWEVDLWDIFESFFGWGNWNFSWNYWTKNSWVKRWEDLEQIVEIDLKTSIYWWEKTINFMKYETCNACKWEGWEWKKACSTCHWTGHITYTKQSIFWIIQQTWICEKCNWTGDEFEKVCNICNWSKRIKIKKELKLDIPAGIDDWMIIKLEWEWNDWIWTKASWDLYVKFKVSLEEKGLKRKWVNLYYDLEIDVLEAILGTKKEINIPIIWKRTIEIKSWTQPWTIIKISEDWVKYIDKDSKWDLFINLEIKIPKKLSKKEKELYLEVAKEKKVNVNNEKWIFEKIFG